MKPLFRASLSVLMLLVTATVGVPVLRCAPDQASRGIVRVNPPGRAERRIAEKPTTPPSPPLAQAGRSIPTAPLAWNNPALGQSLYQRPPPPAVPL